MTATSRKLTVTAVVLTYNEEANLAKCLDSLAPYADEIVVVDSFSTDATVSIAKRYTDHVYQHVYEGHPQQWRWTLENVPTKNEWIFAVDADFVVTPELWRALGDALARGGADGYYVRHLQVFRGRELRHGTLYPRYWLRVFRKARVTIDPADLVDIHFYVNGPVGRLESDVREDNAKERRMGFWVEKQAKFAKRQALEEHRLRRQSAAAPVKRRFFGGPAERILWWKAHWYRAPLFLRPFALFGYRYFLRLGFLDGRQGFLYHFTQALYYRMLVDLYIQDLRDADAMETRE